MMFSLLLSSPLGEDSFLLVTGQFGVRFGQSWLPVVVFGLRLEQLHPLFGQQATLLGHENRDSHVCQAPVGGALGQLHPLFGQ